MTSNKDGKTFWSQRYREGLTGWDIGYPSIPLRTYIDGLENKSLRILIPGAGNAYEAEYLFKTGFTNVCIVDIVPEPLDAFRQRVPDFPKDQIILDDFFQHQETYDLIFEQTFFCSFPPTKANRTRYAKKMHQLLNPNGKLVGLWFDFPLTGDMEKRPFGGDRTEYLSYLNVYFDTLLFEKCHNSIPPRAGTELFGIFKRKATKENR